MFTSTRLVLIAASKEVSTVFVTTPLKSVSPVSTGSLFAPSTTTGPPEAGVTNPTTATFSILAPPSVS